MKPAGGVWGFLARVISNDNRNLFMVRLGSSLILAKFGVTGPVGDLLGTFLRGLIGLLIEDGTYLIDISIDAYREGEKLDEFKREARLAYQKAMARVYDEKEKNEIRKQYLEIIARIGAVGSGPRK